MGLRVLIPYDIDTTGMRNPYLFLLMRSLIRHREIENLQHGYGWLHEEGEWDIIHLHWPEILISTQLPGAFSEMEIDPAYIDNLEQILVRWKKRGSRIMLTVHNEEPHLDPSGMCGRLYRVLYSLTDGFIHMGARSEELLAERYPEQSAGKYSTVIPHGDYRYFPDNKSRQECREILEIRGGEKLMLSFGAIRTEEELNLGIDAFNRARVPESIYLMAGKLPFPYKMQKQHFPVRRKLYLNRLRGRIKTDERIIPAGQVQHYVNAADLLFIPRFHALNSGNVALGFTFGKVVAGPENGVIGEVLGSTGNPVFDPEDLSSVSAAIRSGFKLAESGLGEKNREYSHKNMDWGILKNKYIKAYKEVKKIHD